MSLLISLRSEVLKTKRTASFYLTIIAAAVVPVILLIDFTVDGIRPESTKVILNKMFTQGFAMTGFAIFPIFVMLICTLLPQIEYKNNAWKQVLTSPQTRVNVFVSKFLNIHLLIVVLLISTQLFMLLIAVIWHFVHPSWNVLGQSVDVYQVLVTMLNTYVCVLAIGAIQFWMGLRFNNFIVPVAIGIAFWFVGSLMTLEYSSPYAKYFPYSFQVYPLFPKYKPQLNQVEWTSAGYAAVFLILGFLDFRRSRTRA